MPPQQRLIIAALGALFVLYGVWRRLRATLQVRAANRWPVVTGKIVHASIGREQTKQFVAYRAVVAYSYRVEGVELTGGRINLIDDGLRGRPSDAEEELTRCRPGSVVAVHYDPAFPARSCLVIDNPPRNTLNLVWFGIAVAIGGVLFPDWY